MLRKESDGIFNLHAISFLTVAVFLTVFSVAYADWHVAKITGYAVIENYVDNFKPSYVTPYFDYMETSVAIEEGGDQVIEFKNLVDDCDRSDGNDCEQWIADCAGADGGEADCSIYVLGVNGIVGNQANFEQWMEDFIDPYIINSQCLSDIQDCSNDGSVCPGEIIMHYDFWTNGGNADAFSEILSDHCYLPEGSCSVGGTSPICKGSTQPPTAVIEEVSENVEAASQGASYAESVSKAISTETTSESDLFRYKANLEQARKEVADAYKKSYDISNKYSSFVLSEYQQEIALSLADIDKQLRDIDNILTESVQERFERQAEHAVWSIEHEESVQSSAGLLETFFTGMTTIGFDTGSSSTPTITAQQPGLTTGESTTGQTTAGGTTGAQQETAGEPGGAMYSESDLVVTNPGTIVVYPSEIESFPLTIYNQNPLYPLTNCRISAIGSEAASWFSYQGFPNPQYGFNSLGPEESGQYSISIEPPGGSALGVYFINLRVYCNQEEDGLTLRLELQNGLGGGGQGQTGEIPQEVLNAMLMNYPVSLLNAECSDVLNSCSAEVPNTCGTYPFIYACAIYQNCANFEQECVPNYISESQMSAFISQYVTPWYNLPTQCLQDVSVCATNSLWCEPYIYECAVNGNCNQYIEQCINSQTTQAGVGGQGAAIGGGSSGGSTISQATVGGVTTTTTTGASQEPDIYNACQGDSVCIALSETCLTPSYIIATNLNLVDFGGFGYNAVTGEICYMGPSVVFVSGIRPGIVVSQFPGNVGTGNQPGGNSGNNIISIHFQNSGEGSNRNYVAAIVYSLNGHLTLNFLNSPDYNDLEDKIQDFINRLLYGDAQGSYITGMSLQQAEEIVAESASVPWVLWIILFVMVISFVMFGNLLAPYNERLIYSGKKALNKKDYAIAIKNYNELADTYSNDVKVKQDALEYLKHIKEKVGPSKIDLEFADKGSLPKIKTSHSVGVFSNYHRVQKMISHALQDVKKSPKLAKSRMSLISEEYRRLIPKDKERLASQYEGLVYKLRNV